LKGPPRLLLFDDLHTACVSPDIVTFLDALLRLLPPQVRVLATSRTPPPLALERMRVRGELFELDAARLRLSREEMAELLGRALGRSPTAAEIARHDQASAGWPAAVQLALEAIRRDPAPGLDARPADVRLTGLVPAAARVFRSRGESERAVRHALDGSDGALANDLLLELSPALLRQGRASLLLQMLDDAPAAAGETAAVLTLARADALAALGRW